MLKLVAEYNKAIAVASKDRTDPYKKAIKDMLEAGQALGARIVAYARAKTKDSPAKKGFAANSPLDGD
jgi:hypothetical protein